MEENKDGGEKKIGRDIVLFAFINIKKFRDNIFLNAKCCSKTFIGATIRISQEIWCLPYAGFLLSLNPFLLD